MLKRFTSALTRLAGAAEPRYDGRPVRWWIPRLEDDDPKIRSGAEAAFAAMGPPAVPVLLEALKGCGADKRRARRLAEGLAAIRPDGSQMLFRALAADPQHPAFIEAYRQIVAGRVEDLIPLMRGDAEMRDTLVDWLRNEGARVIPPLLFFMSDESFDVRFGVLCTLLRMLQAGTPLPPAGFDPLIRAMSDPEPPVRAAAAAALAFTGERAAGAVEALRRGLRDDHAKVRLACAKTLGGIGPAAAAALPEVLALNDEPLLAAQAAGCLAAGNGEARSLIQERFSTPEMRLPRAIALAWAGAGDADVISALMDELKGSDQERAAHAVRALGALGPVAGAALSDLARLRREKVFGGALEWPLHEAILRIKKREKDN